MTVGGRLRPLWPSLLILVLALGHRLAIMADRAAAPNELSAWDPLPEGSDQNSYYRQFLDLQEGRFPPARFYYQPGIVYFLGFAGLLTGSDGLLQLRLFTAALAALNCALTAAFTWRATGRRGAGLAAGLLLALYPVSAFYDTDLVITAMFAERK